MSSDQHFPQWVEYRQHAIDGSEIAGCLALSDLLRVRDAVTADSGAPVCVTLRLAESEQRRVVVTGRVETELVLSCQRCLKPVNRSMVVDVAGMVAGSDEEAARVPRAWEPIMAEGGELDLHGLIEDELLLAWPMIVHCDRPACRAVYEREQDVSASVSAPDKRKPFAALASLKNNGKKPQDDNTG